MRGFKGFRPDSYRRTQGSALGFGCMACNTVQEGSSAVSGGMVGQVLGLRPETGAKRLTTGKQLSTGQTVENLTGKKMYCKRQVINKQ